MSQVKMIAIDLISPAEASSDVSMTGTTNSENKAFSQLVDQQIQQQNKPTTPDESSANKSSAAYNTDDENKIAAKAKHTETVTEDVTNNATNKGTSNESSAETNSEDSEGRDLSSAESQTVEDNQDAELNADEKAVKGELDESRSENSSKALIDLLAKSEQLLQKIDNTAKQVGMHEESELGDAVKSDVKHVKVELSNISTGEKDSLKDKSSGKENTNLTGNESEQKLTALAESLRHVEDESYKSKVGESTEIDVHKPIDYITSERTKQKETLLSASEAQSAKTKSVEQVTKAPELDLVTENKSTLSESNKDLFDGVSDKVVSSAKSDVSTTKVIGSQQDKTEKVIVDGKLNSHSELSQSVTEQAANADDVLMQASTKPSELSANKFEPSRVSQAVNQATSSVVKLSGDNQANAESNSENTQQENNFSSEQLLKEKQTAPAASQTTLRSSFAETIAATMGTSAIQEQLIDQQAVQQQLDHIASRVVESNQTVAKSQQMQLETINIYRRDFANAVKEKVMVMVNQKLNQVEIQLDPPELGNVHVRLNLQNEQAMVSFTVQNQQAKEAFEQQMGKLREMLQESGVDVGDANVAQQGQQNEGGQEKNLANGNGIAHEDENINMSNMAQLVKPSATGIDFYA